ncbi:uncharacterized protein BDZ99DRAFT_576809 [Mytilinidion resinicola]|uniref:Uncharacterized protein n=1 Tax=Mytilinidion resinicola TaxID=574789 RepID=A0A6A6Y334_9PEZI|nr:uncharacterized protein BDZ99DRAFT_576809 [Mytilinidion resinicola]KAF2802424.1 hypothetical protein BDZ99DRAFT_576809 [Mytilinidion resinicola]
MGGLGPFPARWWEKWDAKDKYFSEDGSWKEEKKPDFNSLAEHLVFLARGQTWKTSEMCKDEFTALEDFLKKMLVYESTNRITVNEAVASEWAQKRAIADITEADPQCLLSLIRKTCNQLGPRLKEYNKLKEAQNAADAAEEDDLVDKDEKLRLKQHADHLYEQIYIKDEEKREAREAQDMTDTVIASPWELPPPPLVGSSAPPGPAYRSWTPPDREAWRISMLAEWMKGKAHHVENKVEAVEHEPAV